MIFSDAIFVNFKKRYSGGIAWRVIKHAEVLEEYILEVTFQNNVIKYYDVSELFEKWNVFQELKKDRKLFEQVKVDEGGYGISWNDNLDLSCNELWENGYIVYLTDKFFRLHIEKIIVWSLSFDYGEHRAKPTPR